LSSAAKVHEFLFKLQQCHLNVVSNISSGVTAMPAEYKLTVISLALPFLIMFSYEFSFRHNTVEKLLAF